MICDSFQYCNDFSTVTQFQEVSKIYTYLMNMYQTLLLKILLFLIVNFFIIETVRKPIHVNMHRDIKMPLRKHNLELPMSPHCIPSNLCIDDINNRQVLSRLYIIQVFKQVIFSTVLFIRKCTKDFSSSSCFCLAVNSIIKLLRPLSDELMSIVNVFMHSLAFLILTVFLQ